MVLLSSAAAMVVSYLSILAAADVPVSLCRSFCGNLTIDFPFGLRHGCGHHAFRELLFCINGILMLHLPSASYRVLDIDYAFSSLTLHDPAMSDCYSIKTGSGSGSASASVSSGGFVVEQWRSTYFRPAPDNAFLLLNCKDNSALFQGFPSRHLPCRNISGISCEDYFTCPAWSNNNDASTVRHPAGEMTQLQRCCSVGFGVMGGINLTHLGCEGYSSAYSLAPLRHRGPGEWSYGIRVDYNVPSDDGDFCKACQATGGLCGFDTGATTDHGKQLCFCEGWNSTSNCDSSATVNSSATATERLAIERLLRAYVLGAVLIIVLHITAP